MLTPEAFATLVATLPAGSRTMGDLMHHLDETAHEAENAGDWWEAANIRQTQADVLRFIQSGIVGGVLSVDRALDATHTREAADPALAHCIDCGRSLPGPFVKHWAEGGVDIGAICDECAGRRTAARDDRGGHPSTNYTGPASLDPRAPRGD
jgi:hypothetical protein